MINTNEERVTRREDHDTRREMLIIEHEAYALGEKLHAERRRKHKQCYAEQQLKAYRKNHVRLVDSNFGLR